MAGRRKPLDRNAPDYWQKRKKLGRLRKIKSPEELWRLATEYFERREGERLLKQDFIRSGEKAGTIVNLENILPFTWSGLSDYLLECGIVLHDTQELRTRRPERDNRYTFMDFAEVLQAIDKVMHDQKLSGAASGAFNATIIARDLGLTDKSEVSVQTEQPVFGDPEEPKKPTKE